MKPFALAATLLSIICACSVESGGGDEDTGGIDAGGADAANIPRPPDAAAIGPVDLTDFCNQWNTAVCTHLYSCLTPEEREAQGLPATQGECVAAQAPDCEEATSDSFCDSGETYVADQAMPCLTQFGALTCELFLDPDHDAVLAANAPACVAMCQ